MRRGGTSLLFSVLVLFLIVLVLPHQDFAWGDDPYCGDGTCNNGETCSFCPSDCGSCAYCGDHNCNDGETCATCPGDCGVCCGNGVLNTGEACDYARSPTGCVYETPYDTVMELFAQYLEDTE